MTKNEWIKLYEKKAEPYYVPPDYIEIFEPDKGFLFYKLKDDVLDIGHCCTNDMAYWDNKAIEIAKANKCKEIHTITMRSPRAYIKMTGAHLNLGGCGYKPNGLWYWAMERTVM